MGTHVSQAPDRCVGEVVETKSRRWSRIGCTGIKKENPSGAYEGEHQVSEE
jgi:hypothetical protein